MRVTVLGAGYAGLVTAACLAEFGHDVINADIDAARVEELDAGRIPIFEPGLGELVERNAAKGRLHFTDQVGSACAGREVVFLVVGTPPQPDGRVDLTQVDATLDTIARHLDPGVTVVIKSTVPVGTTADVASRLRELRPDIDLHFASNPEFLRQGAAVDDFLHPDRIVVGAEDATAAGRLRELYRPLTDEGFVLVETNPQTAELIKYAANAFLGLKLSFINEIADFCEASGAIVDDVAIGIGLDDRIAPGFLAAGPGFGGSCLPKDTQALLHTVSDFGTGSRIVGAALEVNRARRAGAAGRVERALGRGLDGATIGVLGVTFKANTDDTRESPAIDLIDGLLANGAVVRAFDPQGMPNAARRAPDAVYVDSVEAALDGADCMVIATEWREFATLDLAEIVRLLAHPIVIDFRNLYEPKAMTEAGISYYSVGRPAAVPDGLTESSPPRMRPAEPEPLRRYAVEGACALR